MSWKNECIPALKSHHLFLSPVHFQRFTQLFNYLRDRAFFNKGLCKCIFLASWDQERYNSFMETMEELIARDAQDLSYMAEKGKAKLPRSSGNEKTLYKMSMEFITRPGYTPDEDLLLNLSSAWVPVADNIIDLCKLLEEL